MTSEKILIHLAKTGNNPICLRLAIKAISEHIKKEGEHIKIRKNIHVFQRKDSVILSSDSGHYKVDYLKPNILVLSGNQKYTLQCMDLDLSIVILQTIEQGKFI